MSTMKAIFTSPASADKLVLREAAIPGQSPNEALVAVKAFSLNLGETKTALAAQTEARVGWDFAGVVERAAADGTGPKQGARVVGVSLKSEAWAQYVAASARFLAELPPSVSFADASALPVAGLTALAAIEKGGLVLGKSILVTGASGGVGRLACQLGVAAGARITALVRREDQADALRADGVADVVIGEHLAANDPRRYDLVIDSVGGNSLAKSIARLASHGVCVTCGNSTGEPTTFQTQDFYRIGAVSIHGLFLGVDLQGKPATPGLSLLARLVADGRLRPPIASEEPWQNIAAVAKRFVHRGVSGKAVLHLTH